MYKFFLNLLSLLFVFASSSIVDAFDNAHSADREEPRPSQAGTPAERVYFEFTTNDKIKRFSQLFTTLSNDTNQYPKLKEYLSLDFKIEVVGLDRTALEDFYFSRARAAVCLYRYLAETHKEDLPVAQKYHRDALAFIEQYLGKRAGIDRSHMTAEQAYRKFLMLHLAGQVYHQLGELLPSTSTDNSPSQENTWPKALGYCEKALDMLDDISTYDRENINTASIHNLAFEISYHLCCLTSLQEFFHKTEQHLNALCKTDFYEEANKKYRALINARKISILKQRAAKASTPLARQKLNRQVTARFQDNLEILHEEDLFTRNIFQIHTLLSSRTEDWATQVIQLITEIEDTIRPFLPDADRTDLRKVYTPLFKDPTHTENLYSAMEGILAAFVHQDADLQRALDRTEVFAHFLPQENDNLISLFKYIRATLKNLQGEPQELNALIERKEKKRAQRAKKKKAHQLAKITEAVAQKEEEQRLREEREAALAQKANRVSPPPLVATPQLPELPYAVTTSHQEELEEKLKRHQEAMAQRENDRLRIEAEKRRQEELSQASSAPALPSDFYTTTSVSPIETIPIEGLKSALRRVDNEITENSWSCTRDDIVHYFEGLGCIWDSGKGSHERIKLPRLTHQDMLVGIFAELEDALTLPKWTDTVPFYLRPQIRAMRAKVIALNSEKLVPVAAAEDTQSLFSDKTRKQAEEKARKAVAQAAADKLAAEYDDDYTAAIADLDEDSDPTTAQD